MGKKGEYIRAWLSTVLIARGEYEEAKNEMQNDRGNFNFYRRRAKGKEIRIQIKKRDEIKTLREKD